MKNRICIIIFSVSSLLLFSCKGALDLDPSDRYSEATVWSSIESMDNYVYGLYAVVKDNAEIFKASNFTDAYTDIMKSSSWNQYDGHSYNMVLLQENAFNNTGAGTFECWTNLYNRIKRENEFLRDAPSYKGRFGDAAVDTRIAEVRLVRAYAYSLLIRVYGGVVIRSSVDGPDNNDKERSSEKDSWAFVMSEMEEAAKALPKAWPASEDGRVTKAAAWGLLSRAALYAKEWEKVIEASDSCAAAGGALASDYASIFSDRLCKENLFTVQFLPGYPGSVSHQHDAFFRPIGDRKKHNNVSVYSAFGPTSELTDSYEMKDGSAFSWALHRADPYTGREPRFYATILYNGADWEGRKIESFEGGEDGIRPFELSGTASASVTGYYFRKFITENDKSWETLGSSHFGIIIRYGEVLLNKAEALNESGELEKALDALNAIRKRAGLPDAGASDSKAFMELLRHERMIELAGEGFRYWDIRRWRLGDEILNGKQAHGVHITKDQDTGTLTYTQIPVDAGRKRVFYERYYAFSLPVSERSNNKLLGPNNPGW